MAANEEPPDKRARRESGEIEEEIGEEMEEEIKPYKIQKIQQTVVRKYGVEEYTFRAKFDDELQGTKIIDIKDDLQTMFGDVLEEVGRNYQPGERVRMSINHDGMDREMTIHLQQRENITPEMIMGR